MEIKLFIRFLVFILLLIGMFFNRRLKAQKKNHSLQVNQLQYCINIHKSQVTFRDKKLNKYDFLRYNLSESLVMQEEMKCFEYLT